MRVNKRHLVAKAVETLGNVRVEYHPDRAEAAAKVATAYINAAEAMDAIGFSEIEVRNWR